MILKAHSQFPFHELMLQCCGAFMRRIWQTLVNILILWDKGTWVKVDLVIGYIVISQGAVFQLLAPESPVTKALDHEYSLVLPVILT